MTTERYSGNLKAFTEAELGAIRAKSVCVVGCGGLGGFVCNALARFGVGGLTIIDGDVFSESNLNRQLFSTAESIGKPKAETAREQLVNINPDVCVSAFSMMLDETNAGALLSGHDLVIDCLDNAKARLVLERACEKLGLPFIHGAISGFVGQVAPVFPGSRLMEKLYGALKRDIPPGGNPVFTAQAVSALQCAEALKLLAGRELELRGKMLLIDLSTGEFETIYI